MVANRPPEGRPTNLAVDLGARPRASRGPEIALDVFSGTRFTGTTLVGSRSDRGGQVRGDSGELDAARQAQTGLERAGRRHPRPAAALRAGTRGLGVGPPLHGLEDRDGSE